MALTALVAAGVFAGTNVDDLLVLAVLFGQARTAGRPRAWQIWAGQCAGIAVLVAASAAVALGLAVVPDRWVGLLGVVPLAMGVHGLVAGVRAARRARADGQAPRPAVLAPGALAVAGLTVANGADNIAAYTPLLRAIDPVDGVLTCAVFALLTAAWCLAGAWLGAHRWVAGPLERFGHWLVPAVFIALGAAILAEAGLPG